ncbi:MAG: hypothetical protein LLG20_18295 [Acidobacteriales bacterium]|nr:hypothetical protein [Terriglobales bacterium]
MDEPEVTKPTPDKKPRKRRKTRAKRTYRKREAKTPMDTLPGTFPERILAACGVKTEPLEPVPMPMDAPPPVMPERPRFEYCRENLSTGADEILARLGEQGWEMCGVLGDWVGVFRRRKG